MINENTQYIKVIVTPQSNKDEITEIKEDEKGITIKINLKAKAKNNMANLSLISFLNKKISRPDKNIKIINGKNSRSKLIKIF